MREDVIFFFLFNIRGHFNPQNISIPRYISYHILIKTKNQIITIIILLLIILLHFQLIIIIIPQQQQAILPHPTTALHSVRSMSIPKGTNMVLKRPLVLEIRPTDTEPQLPAVLLVRPPVTSHRKRLPALPAPERLRPVLPLVVRLEGPEVLQRP